MQDLIKQQEEEFEQRLESSIKYNFTGGFEKKFLKDFISEVRKETAEYVCDKMTEEEEFCCVDCLFEYQEKIKQSILQEFSIGELENEKRM